MNSNPNQLTPIGPLIFHTHLRKTHIKQNWFHGEGSEWTGCLKMTYSHLFFVTCADAVMETRGQWPYRLAFYRSCIFLNSKMFLLSLWNELIPIPRNQPTYVTESISDRSRNISSYVNDPWGKQAALEDISRGHVWNQWPQLHKYVAMSLAQWGQT